MAPAGGQPGVGLPPRPPGPLEVPHRLTAPPAPGPPAAGGAPPKPGFHPGYRPGFEPGYRPGAEAAYRPGPEPGYRHPAPGQEPGYRPGQEPGYRPGQEPGYRPPGSEPGYRPGPEAGYRPPGADQYRAAAPVDPSYRAAPEQAAPPVSVGAPVPYGGHPSMYGSPYGRAAPAQAPPPGGQPYPYPGQQPWPSGAAPPSKPTPGGAPAPRAPLSPHFLRHQMQQKLQYGVAPPPRPASQGSDGGPAGGEAPHPALVGPDGTPLDEGSQHSTLSNASANSEEACRSPKSRRDGPGSQPPTPLSGLAFSGAPGGQDEDSAQGQIAGAAWTRSPGSKMESLSRLFEMDDTPGRREWVNRLLAFMEERGTPILQCPTVSKQPLDLFKLYHFTKERGGFVEVSTSKTWKDVATVMGIGGSSSGAYTLRKHYMKHLLSFECHFDRGGQDPAPIIAKFETKSSKKAKRSSSPGPQDSFSNSGSLDGFPSGYPTGYPPRPEYNGTGPQMPPQGYPGHPGYPGQPPQPGYSPYPRPPGAGQEYPPQQPQQSQQQQQQYMQQYPNRTFAGGPGGAEYRYPGPPPGPATYGAQRPPPPPPGAAGPAGAPPPPPGYGPGEPYPAVSAAPAGPPPPAGYSTIRAPGGTFTSQLARQLTAPSSLPRASTAMSGAPKVGAVAAAAPTLSRQLAAPPTMVTPAQQQQQHQLSMAQHRPPYSHGPAPVASSGLPRPYGAGPASSLPPGALPPRSAAGAPSPYTQPQPPQPQPQQAQQQQQQPYGWRGGSHTQWPPRYPGPGPWSGAQPTPGQRPPARPDRTPHGAKPVPASYLRPAFPPDSVEATLPVMARRRRGARADVCPVDGWRLTMALRSGQLAESRWALDVLQILTFDDTAVVWMGLPHMPGLLAALLQHFRQALTAMFARRTEGEWFEDGEGEVAEEPDLGAVRPVDPADRQTLLSGRDFSRMARDGRAVELVDRDDAILVSGRRRAWEVADADGAWQHVLTHVKVESGRVKFQRRIKDGRIKDDGVKAEPDDEPPGEGVDDGKPTDERLKGFEEPGFFLDRLRRPAPVTSGAVSAGGDATVKRENGEVAVKQEADAVTREAAVKTEPMEAECAALEEGADDAAVVTVTGEGGATLRLEVRDPAGSLKRRRQPEEDECEQRDESSLFLTSETQENVASRCLAAATVLRNLSFVPGNEPELACEPVLALLGDLLLLHHRHPARAAPHANYDRDEDADQREPCPALAGDEWWADYLPALHEAALVTLGNIAGHVRLAALDEPVVRPVLDGLLHWLQCPASYAADPLAAGGPTLPAALLALEALCRLCVHADNVDLLLATPPAWRLERVCRLAARWLAADDSQVRREMALTLLHALAAADERAARLLAGQPGLAATLVRFVETAEQSALGVANSQGVNALRDNPELMGTSLDLLGRAAGLLLSLAGLPEARPALARCESRLLALVTSQILDQRVAATLSRVLYSVAEVS